MRLRSKYPEYTLAGIKFVNGLSPEITDTSIISQIRKDPAFGHDYWEVDLDREARIAEAARAASEGAGKSDPPTETDAERADREAKEKAEAEAKAKAEADAKAEAERKKKDKK